MRICDRYVFGEMILPFLIGTLAVLLMMVGTTLYDMLPGVLQNHWPVSVVFRVCVLVIPSVMVRALPVSTALAVSLATNRMARDNEFTVMRTAGAPLLRAFAPMFLFGALIGVADLYIADHDVPWAYREQQNIVQYLISNLGSNPVDVGQTFKQDNYTISFASAQKVSETKRRLNRVIIVTDPTTKSADYAEITTAATADYEGGVWTFRDVVYHHYSPDGMTQFDAKAPTATLRLQVDFSSVYQPPQPDQVKNFTTADLIQRADLARRMGNFRDARTWDVERWFRPAFAAMCFALAICCPPLGLRFARTGTFTGVLLSIITCFVAWNTILLLQMIALGGYIPPFAAAWFNVALFVGLGIWLFRTQE